MTQPRILAFVMAGGEGTRLRPFTTDLPKPALPFGGGHRIIDFVLSNLHHSRIHHVYVLLQYRPQVLLEHIGRHWAAHPGGPGGFVAPVLPDSGPAGSAFRGTADAVRQCLGLVERHAPDLIAVFAADHVYRMDIRQMARFHLEHDAEASVAAVPVPVEEASGFGIVGADHDQRIRTFEEKPLKATPMPGNPRLAYASMGNYLFHPVVLARALHEAARRGEHDFGRHVLPRLIHDRRVYAYDFSGNIVPGVAPHEESGYWRDVGHVEAYVAAHRDLLGPTPRFRLDNVEWPILCGDQDRSGPRQQNSILGPQAVTAGAVVRNSVLQRGAVIEPGAWVENCIVMNGATVRRGARLRGTLVGPQSLISPRTRIGYNRDADRRRFDMTPSGTVIVPPGTGCAGARSPLLASPASQRAAP
jgi:glucose-1-phosphate adenylyltransferase